MDDGIPPTKLTLRLDRRLVERAKRYARERGTSVSQMVADHFRALTLQDAPTVEQDRGWERELGPLTRSLVGIIEGSELDVEDHLRHLKKKHLPPASRRDAQ